MSTPFVLRAGAWDEGITPSIAGWRFIGFKIEQFSRGKRVEIAADDHERALVALEGRFTAIIGEDRYEFGGRATVFDGAGACLYVPRDTAVVIEASDAAALAIASSPASIKHDVVLVSPEDTAIEIRGGGNATRQVATLMPPAFPADRLLVVEVWTPGGNWSSFPPHKHEVDRHGLEAELEETYYYRLRDRKNGWGMQRAYSPEREFELDAVIRDGDLSVLPWGYHTSVAAHGHDLYYLNVLAGPAPTRTLQASQDPALAATAKSWPALGTYPEQLPVLGIH